VINLNPNSKISLQRHKHRAEHWVVVAGTATVTRGDDIIELKQNESTFIPIGMIHRIENKTSDLLEIIEVQSGSYLGEDDIERFDDDYGRHK
jgi:mannose-1-phosphate guanylyltransferase/mannose-6-phosphate isomerase